jgi:hypothetical protein
MGNGRVRIHLRWLALGAGALLAAALWLLLAQAPVRADGVPLSIRIEGNHFVDGAGQTIRLLGVDHASSEYACVDGYGYNDGHQDDADAAAIAAWHANAVRIPLNEDCWLGANGQPSGTDNSGNALTEAGYRQAIVAYVDALNAHGLYAILDLHWSAPGSQVALEQQPMPDEQYSPAFWQSVASTFKGDPAVVFDVFNEPFDPTDPRSGADLNPADKVSWNCWETGTENGPAGGTACNTQAYDENDNPTSIYRIAGLQTLVDSIRSAGATQPIMTGGLNFANDLSGWADHAPDDPLNQEAASFHNYPGQACDTVDCWNATVAPVAANVPVVTGEFDEDDYQNPSCTDHTPGTFDSDYMNWADQHGVSYLAWGWELLSSSEINQQGCSAYYLTSDTAGSPAPPNGTSLHDHLAALYSASTTGTTTGTTTTGTTSTGTTTTGTTTTTTSTQTTEMVPAVTLSRFGVRVPRGGAAVDFVLRATQSCSGVLAGRTVGAFAAARKRHRVELGSVRFRLSAGKSKTVALKLSAKAKRLLRSRHSLKVRITVTLSAGGGSWVTHRTPTLELPTARRRKH